MESQDLFVELDVSRLKLLRDFGSTSEMVGELSVREGLAGVSLVGFEVKLGIGRAHV